MKIDHVTIAGPRLERLLRRFASIGLAAEPGGAHSNNVTHMAVVGFDDGSYIELISTIEHGARSPWWDTHIRHAAGPCGWAVDVADVGIEAARFEALGIAVRGPVRMQRARPDGQRIEWELAIPGTGAPGVLLPFAIHDLTPRAWRIEPSPSVAGGPVTGIAAVVLGVADLDGAARVFAKAHGLSASDRMVDSRFGATLAKYRDAPIILATPLDRQNWLGRRLAQFGPCPCAYVLHARDLRAAEDAWALRPGAAWFEQPMRWFDAAGIDNMRLAVTASID